jgi:hypothetical protein
MFMGAGRSRCVGVGLPGLVRRLLLVQLSLLPLFPGCRSVQRQNETVHLVAFIGLRHTYDVPNAIAAQVAVDRVNADALMLPHITLKLDALDSTIIYTAPEEVQGVSPTNLQAAKRETFSEMLSNSLRVICANASNGGKAPTGACCLRSGGVAGVIGPLYSSEAKILRPLLQQHSLLAMSYGATSPALSDAVKNPNLVARFHPTNFKGRLSQSW